MSTPFRQHTATAWMPELRQRRSGCPSPASAEEGGLSFGDFSLATQRKSLATTGGRTLLLYKRQGRLNDRHLTDVVLRIHPERLVHEAAEDFARQDRENGTWQIKLAMNSSL
jgi:hypothetical protein